MSTDELKTEREFAITALREVLGRALWVLRTQGTDENPQPSGWDQAFASMAPDDQVDWLIMLFKALTNGEIRSIDEILEEGNAQSGGPSADSE